MNATPDSTLAELRRTIADLRRANTKLQRKLEDRSAERDEAFAQQAATSDVLKTISRSAFDLQQVLDTLCETAARLCESDGAGIALREGRLIRYAAVYATYGIDEYSAFLRQRSFEPGRDTTIGRVALEGDVVHIADIAADPEYALPQSTAVGKIRTNLGVPLLRDGLVVGMLTLFRQRVEPFTKRQIELVQTFADQAVIAMENARLITETREALEQRTATAEVLQVINSSPGALTPVFDAMLEKATNLCEAAAGTFWIFESGRYRGVAFRGMPEAFVDFACETREPGPAIPMGGITRGDRFVHALDLQMGEGYRTGDPLARIAVDTAGVRTMLAIPLRKEGNLLGQFSVYRREVRPFSDKQIALLQNFAEQAVVAMENARLITETREALEQQTATAEVLGVINSSPGDLAPVFDAILEKAHSLCGVATGALSLTDGGVARTMAIRGAPRAYAEAMGQPFRPPPESPIARIMQGAPFVQIPDMAELARKNPDDSRGQAVAAAGLRTSLFLPLRREGEMIGYITAYRREVRPFASKEIALLQNFAAQAVIAIENARLLTETREALEQQTATGEILRVVSGSQSHIQPVFEAIVESASKLCAAELSAVARYDGAQLDLVALNNMSPGEAAAFHSLFPRVPLPSFVMGRAVIDRRPVNVEDVLSEPGYDSRTRETLAGPWQYRSFLGVPILREGEPIGVIGCGRREVRPFTASRSNLSGSSPTRR